MSITIEITDAEVEQFIKDVLENLPEASAGMALQCVKYNYKDCIYEFVDEEENEMKHTLTMEKAKKGLQLLVNDVVKGKVFVIDKAYLFDPGEWDAFTVDALVQYSLLGECVYG